MRKNDYLKKMFDSEVDESVKSAIKRLILDQEELKRRKKKDKPQAVIFGSSGQVSYLYGGCPTCGYSVKYHEYKIKCYCSECGQRLYWADFEKHSAYEIKQYKVVYRIRNLSETDTTIISGINLKEAVLDFYESNPNRFEILSVKEWEPIIIL